MLLFLDIFFTIFHLLVTGFNLLGWIPKATRRVHRWCVGITAACWFLAGAWVGNIGYCPLTDWHWQIKYARGATDLPLSFITWLLNIAGFYPSPAFVDMMVGTIFAAIVIITFLLWWRDTARRAKPSG